METAGLASNFEEQLLKMFNFNAHLCEPKTDNINLREFELRTTYVNGLRNLLTSFADMTTLIENKYNLVKGVHENETKALNALLNIPATREHTKQSDDSSWTMVRSKCRAPQRAKQAVAESRGSIKITDSISIAAIRVPAFSEVRADGELYYVESADHFAFILGGVLINGNIGIIYTDEKNPTKIKDCKFANRCLKTTGCHWYHNPLQFPGSKDCRNFIASSCIYAPPGSEYKRPRSRKFGSRDNLDADITDLTEDDVNRFNDQSMHDLLCSLILRNLYRNY